MSKTTMYFIRHGEIDNPKQEFYGNSRNLPLIDEGRGQARKIAEVIKSRGEKIDKIFTSPLTRGKETADSIARVLGRPPIMIVDGLTDVYIPALVGHPISERDDIHARGEDEYSGEFVEMGNESREQIAQRILGAIKIIRIENEGKTVIVVSHGDPLRFLKFCLENPKQSIPLMGELIKLYYPEKGEGWKMVFDGNGQIIERELITRERNIKLEKESK